MCARREAGAALGISFEIRRGIVEISYFLDLIASTEDQVVTSAIASMELLCAFERKEFNGDIKLGGAQAIFQQYLDDSRNGSIIEIPYGHDVVWEARKIIEQVSSCKIWIGSLDLIHLASALIVKAKSIVATDSRLRQTAALMQLQLIPG